eukprot:PhM_4_TR2457/c3_g3_i1/m.64697
MYVPIETISTRTIVMMAMFLLLCSHNGATKISTHCTTQSDCNNNNNVNVNNNNNNVLWCNTTSGQCAPCGALPSCLVTDNMNGSSSNSSCQRQCCGHILEMVTNNNNTDHTVYVFYPCDATNNSSSMSNVSNSNNTNANNSNTSSNNSTTTKVATTTYKFFSGLTGAHQQNLYFPNVCETEKREIAMSNNNINKSHHIYYYVIRCSDAIAAQRSCYDKVRRFGICAVSFLSSEFSNQFIDSVTFVDLKHINVQSGKYLSKDSIVLYTKVFDEPTDDTCELHEFSIVVGVLSAILVISIVPSVLIACVFVRKVWWYKNYDVTVKISALDRQRIR